MNTYLKDAFGVVVFAVFLYLLAVAQGLCLVFYYAGAMFCAFGLYRIIVPLTKEAEQAKGIQEKHLLTYSKQSGLLDIVAGILFIVYGYISGLIWAASYASFSFTWGIVYNGVNPVTELFIIASFVIIPYFCRKKLKRKYGEINEENNEKDVSEENKEFVKTAIRAVVGISKKSKYKEFARGLIIVALAFVLCLAAIAISPNTAKGVALFSNNVRVSDIVYENRVEIVMGYETILIVHVNSDKEVGFASMRVSNANILYPLLPLRAYVYSFYSRYTVDLETGNVTIIFNDRLRFPHDKNVKRDDIRIKYDYWHPNRVIPYAYMGISHEFVEIEGAEYKFIEYFDDIFDGVYVYFFVSYEQLDSDLCFSAAFNLFIELHIKGRITHGLR